MQAPRNNATGALVGIWAVLLMAFVIAILYVGRDVLIPIALAALITFLLSPVVGRLERWLGRIVSVLLVVLMVFALIGAIGWMLTTQTIDLAAKLPDYQANIEAKMRAFRMPSGGTFARFNQSLQHLQKTMSSSQETAAKNETSRRSRTLNPAETTAAQPPVPVKIVEPENRLTSFGYDELLACARGELFGAGNAQLPLPPMLMFDRISEIAEAGGKYGKGLVRAVLELRPDLWFFPCHFKGDPVMPGCLGLDALWQLLGFFLGWLGAQGRGRALGLGELKFSGQVLPTVKKVVYGIDIKRVMRSKLVLGIADGWLSADGSVIYQALDLKVGLFREDPALQPAGV